MLTKFYRNPFYLFLVLFFVVWGVRATFFYEFDQFVPEQYRMYYGWMFKVLLWLLPVFLYIKLVEKTSITNFLNLKSFGQNKIVSISLILIYSSAIIFSSFYSGDQIFQSISFSGLILLLLKNIISPFSEEVVFRGLIQKKFQEKYKPLESNVLTSVLFVGIHLPNWFWVRGFTIEVFSDAIGVLIFSLLAGYLMIRSKSIWPPTWLHIINNIVPNLFL